MWNTTHSIHPQSSYPHGQDPDYYIFLNPSHSITSLNDVVTPPIQHWDAATVQYLPVPLVQLRDPCGKNSHLTLLVLRQAFARVTWSSGHSSLNILIWSREIWKPSNGDRKLCTWDFCHHCDLEGWKPGRYESQRQWNFVSRKLGVATFYLCLSSTLLKLMFYGTGGLSISLLDALLLASLRKGFTLTLTPKDVAQSDLWP